MKQIRKEWKEGVNALNILVLVAFILALIGLFAWWAFTWSTHTLVWAIFIFGSVLGGTKVKR